MQSSENSEQRKPVPLDCALAALRWPISDITIRKLICKLECKVEGHESGDYPLMDVAYSDCKHDLELLKKLMGS